MKAKLIQSCSDLTVGKTYDVKPNPDGRRFGLVDDAEYPRCIETNRFEVIPDEPSAEPAATTNVVIDGPGEYVRRDGRMANITRLRTQDELNAPNNCPEHIWLSDTGRCWKPDGTYGTEETPIPEMDIIRKVGPASIKVAGPDDIVGRPAIRTFETGATRNLDSSKNDYEGFLSPLVIKAFGDYMTSHRRQKDGTLRDSDNWQKGIPIEVYMKSMFRHFMDVWTIHRGGTAVSPDTGEQVDLVEALNAVLFNVQGMMHETLKKSSQK